MLSLPVWRRCPSLRTREWKADGHHRIGGGSPSSIHPWLPVVLCPVMSHRVCARIPVSVSIPAGSGDGGGHGRCCCGGGGLVRRSLACRAAQVGRDRIFALHLNCWSTRVHCFATRTVCTCFVVAALLGRSMVGRKHGGTSVARLCPDACGACR